MRKVFILAFATLSFMSCGAGEKKDTNTSKLSAGETANSPVQTETAKDAEDEDDVPQSEDHYGIWRMDSTNEVNFTTSHLIAMELRGHVKHVETNNITTVDFDKDGRIVKYRDGQDEFEVSGELNSPIIGLYLPGAAANYEVDLKNKHLLSISGGEYHYSWENKYVYDDKGNLLYIDEQVTEIDDDEKEKNTSNKVKVQVIEADHHGNWTKIKYGTKVETRTIRYYDNPIGGFDEVCTNPMDCSMELKGSIGGDNNCTFSLSQGKGTYKNVYGTRQIKAVSFAGGKLKVEAFDSKSKAQIGFFEGGFVSNGDHTVYKGVFTNTKSGGKVDFNLKN